MGVRVGVQAGALPVLTVENRIYDSPGEISLLLRVQTA